MTSSRRRRPLSGQGSAKTLPRPRLRPPPHSPRSFVSNIRVSPAGAVACVYRSPAIRAPTEGGARAPKSAFPILEAILDSVQAGRERGRGASDTLRACGARAPVRASSPERGSERACLPACLYMATAAPAAPPTRARAASPLQEPRSRRAMPQSGPRRPPARSSAPSPGGGSSSCSRTLQRGPRRSALAAARPGCPLASPRRAKFAPLLPPPLLPSARLPECARARARVRVCEGGCV